ncbi:hypothetical protein AB0F43_03150 [Kribbella sp. NPDC023972]|uniref:hypothetical protein n=1 Tax=Kribbella sp. NPDC023972 TaxID=3154795 RepID=UPI0033C4293C
MPDGSIRRSSRPGKEPLRLYNTPWLAHFFVDQFRLFGEYDDLDLAARLLESSYALGVASHLSIGHAEAVDAVVAESARRGVRRATR